MSSPLRGSDRFAVPRFSGRRGCSRSLRELGPRWNESRREYKRCCFQKGFTYQLDDETGEVIRAVPLNHEARAELEAAMAVQRDKFIAKFGHEPGPDESSRSKIGARTAPSSRSVTMSGR